MFKNTMRWLATILIAFAGCSLGADPVLQDGDIIFHESRSAQSQALRLAMNSRYTHMGIILIEDGVPLVYEAVGPVKLTPLKEWTDRGIGGSPTRTGCSRAGM